MIDDVSIDFTVGMPENAQNVSVAIYPNPATDHLNIVSGDRINQVDVFNQLGQRIYSTTVDGNIFNLNTMTYNKGVYYVRVTTPDGVMTEKVMIR
jgi:hypothetical protein